jgi:AraC-like DNA-binding protein
MGLTVVARGTTLRLGVFGHGPGEPVAARDWWPRTCLVFTEYGAWTVRSKHGGGTASASVMVAGAGGTEYECGHPYGVDDRNLCLIFPPGVSPPPAAFVPVSGRIDVLRRDLRRHLSARRQDAGKDTVTAVEGTATADAGATDELDAIGWSLMHAAGSPDAPAAPGARDRRLAGQLRELLDREYADPELDAVSAGAAIGLDRTRMIHIFRAVTGTTPHRYLVERRVACAAEMLAMGDAPVTDVCFASGFGSVARFQAAFKRAWGVPPSQYRAATRTTSGHSAGA